MAGGPAMEERSWGKPRGGQDFSKIWGSDFLGSCVGKGEKKDGWVPVK